MPKGSMLQTAVKAGSPQLAKPINESFIYLMGVTANPSSRNMSSTASYSIQIQHVVGSIQNSIL